MSEFGSSSNECCKWHIVDKTLKASKVILLFHININIQRYYIITQLFWYYCNQQRFSITVALNDTLGALLCKPKITKYYSMCILLVLILNDFNFRWSQCWREIPYIYETPLQQLCGTYARKYKPWIFPSQGK